MGSRRLGLRARPLAVLAGVLVLLASVPIALASIGGGSQTPVTFRVSVSRHVLAYRGQSATLAIRMQTGTTAETVAIKPVVSVWPDPNVIGSPLTLSDERISGVGRITSDFTSSCCTVPAAACYRGGPPPEGSGVDVSLPAGSTTTLTYRVAIAAPPWRSTVMTVSLTAGVPAVSNDPNAIHEYLLGTHRFSVRGPTGVHIALSVAPGSTGKPIPGQAARVVRRQTVVILGRTSPRLRDQRIRVGFDRIQIGPHPPAGSVHGRIGTATTNENGGFRLAWRPIRAGLYVVDASYPHPTSGLLADRACDLALSVQ